MKQLNALSDNVLVYRVGRIAREVADDKTSGDEIDRGLLLIKRLDDAGFTINQKP